MRSPAGPGASIASILEVGRGASRAVRGEDLTPAPRRRREAHSNPWQDRPMTEEPTVNAIDSYLEVLPAPERDALRRVRRIIRDAYPHAEERISYGIIVFRIDGRDVVGVGRQAHHLGFYTMSPVPVS